MLLTTLRGLGCKLTNCKTGDTPQPPNAQGHFWIPQLELSLGVWQGERLAQTLNWLRWWDADGNLLRWSSEQAETERQRADRLAALLRAQGIAPDPI
jgi:hypothetical protein